VEDQHAGRCAFSLGAGAEDGNRSSYHSKRDIRRSKPPAAQMTPELSARISAYRVVIGASTPTKSDQQAAAAVSDGMTWVHSRNVAS